MHNSNSKNEYFHQAFGDTIDASTEMHNEMNNIIVECVVRSQAFQVSLMDDPVVELIKG